MKAAQAGNQCAGAFGNDNQNAHVAVDALAHLRAPDLHDHVLSVAQGGAMDLGDRGSGERFALECEVSARFVIFCTLTWTYRELGVGRPGRHLLLE